MAGALLTLTQTSIAQAPIGSKPGIFDVTTRNKTLGGLLDEGPPPIPAEGTATAGRAYAAFQRGWYLTALALATPIAEAGDPAAQALLGVLHETGSGIKKDLSKAADWYALAAEQNDIGAALHLAQIYLEGNGVPQDKARAADLFEKAAEAGKPTALYNLALLYQEGEARPRDEQKARDLLMQAAQLNDPQAQYELGLAFLEPITGERNSGKGAFWIGRAARRGHDSAQVYYGVLRFQGIGVDIDRAEGADWFERAALSGNPVGMNRLARVYAYGEGRPQSLATAAAWHFAARSEGVEDPQLDRIIANLDDTTLAEARTIAEDLSITLLAPSVNAAPPSP